MSRTSVKIIQTRLNSALIAASAAAYSGNGWDYPAAIACIRS